MRRSTRLSIKRTNLTPDSSDEDEPKKSKSAPKPYSQLKSPNKKLKQQGIVVDESFKATVRSKANENKNSSNDKNSDGSSSESDIENYLQPVDQIDLNSTFFDVTKPEERKSFDAIECNIFDGINRLSDSESETELEVDNNEISPTKKTKTKITKIKGPKPLVPIINFQHVQDYTRKLEEAKKLVEKYEAKIKRKEKTQEMSTDKKLEYENQDISNLLALGETKLDSSTELSELQPSMNSSDFESLSESEKEDWEEVEEQDVRENQETNMIPKDNLQITVELPTVMRQKKGKDLVASMKRRLNKIRKENQVLVHKVHLLCWIGHGNYVNEILNDESLLALMLSLIPEQYSYHANQKDVNYVEEILKWYKITIPNIEKRPPNDMALGKLLKLQIIRREAFNKKMLVYMFVCLLRSLGIHCRLVLSFQVTPLRPPASELHSLSTKNNDKKDVKLENQETNNSEDSDKEIKNDEINEIQNNKEEIEQKPKRKVEKGTTVGGRKGKNNENENGMLKVNTRTQNAKKDVKLETKSKKRNTKNSDKKGVKQGKQETNNSDDEVDITNDDENKIQNNEEENEQNPKKKEEKHTVHNKKGRRNKNESNTPKKNRRTPNSKKDANLDSDSTNLVEKRTRKTKKEISKPTEKENNVKNLNISVKKPMVNDLKTSNSKQKASLRNVKTTKLESLKVEPQEKPKTRSQSTKEEQSQNKPSNKLDTKPATRSKSTSQLDVKENNTTSDNLQTRKRISLSLKNRNNNQILAKIPQIDGADDSDDEPTVTENSNKLTLNKLSAEKGNPKVFRKHSKRLKSLPDYSEVNSDDEFKPQRSKRSTKSDTQSNSSSSVKPKEKPERNKSVKNHRVEKESDGDSDYDYTPQSTKMKQNDSEDEFYESKVRVKQRIRAKKSVADVEPKPKKGFDIWVEVYLEAEKKWISVDVVKEQVVCASELHSRASHPITYIVAWNKDNSIKDITQRYCPRYNTATRKLRIDKNWWDDTIKPFVGEKTSRDEIEDQELTQTQLEKPLPTTIHEYKNHPLYVLKRHLLKFEALYPPEPAILGFVRKEAVYSRDCVHKLCHRETWYKQAKVVKPGETPYRILRTPKWDKINRVILKDQPLEVFGIWQIQDYEPPTAQNGIVPRNEYGNVELFQPSMLPKRTVHLQLPGLNKLARRMNIDCAPAMVGFDFHSGWNHPVYDGYVVCEEHSESLIAAWYMEQEEQEEREQEKTEKRVYGNWKKLIKGLLIRERLKARYNFGEPSQGESVAKKRKSKGPKFVSKKRRHCSENESTSEDD